MAMAMKYDGPVTSDDDDLRDDEDTLADGEWPVPEQYRVEPQGRHEGEGTVVVQHAGRPGHRSRRFPPDLSPGLLAIVLAALLAIPAAIWLASRGDDEPAAAETTEAPGETTGTTTTPAAPTQPPAKGVSDVVGTRLLRARSLLESAGFRVRVAFEPSNRPEGEVLRQLPRAGMDARADSVVLLTVSGGTQAIAVPDVAGLTASEASRELRAAGLQPEIREVRSSEPAGTVLGQDPAAGTEVEGESVVVVEVARAAPQAVTVTIPDVVGLTIDAARSNLRELGLRSSVTRVPSAEPEGTVLRQSPRAGAERREGHTVALRVSSGPAQVSVPDVTGLDEQSAQQQLSAAGFEIEVVDEPTDDPARDGLVTSQDPAGGTRADKGTLVTLTVARLG